MDELITRFKAEAGERVTTIDRLLAELTSAGDPKAVFDLIREEAHKLKGAAGVLGFPEFKERASELELIAAERGNELNGDAESVRRLLQEAVAALRAALP